MFPLESLFSGTSTNIVDFLSLFDALAPDTAESINSFDTLVNKSDKVVASIRSYVDVRKNDLIGSDRTMSFLYVSIRLSMSFSEKGINVNDIFAAILFL